MSRLFGTDGLRGVANQDLTPDLVLTLGRAAAKSFGAPETRPRFLIATDTRISAHMLESALAAGLLSAGADVMRCGVLPTPAVAFLVGNLEAGAGAVISGSHNPVPDNGIKFFGPDGFKLMDEKEDEIESLMSGEFPRPVGEAVGREHFLEEAAEDRYVEHCLEALEGRSLSGLKVVVDCANGAASITTPDALTRAGAAVIAINVAPDGVNINVDCGSTHPEVVARMVKEVGADVGLAHDGDADRVIAVDETGEVVDGDAIIAALAVFLKERGRLPGDLVVSTVMANLGFRKAMDSAGIKVIETQVGDRYVLEAMLDEGATLGGEQSGHVILLDHSTTGDGLITGLKILDLMSTSGRKLSEIASVVEKFPQVLLNIKVKNKAGFNDSKAIADAVSQAEGTLGIDGRVLVRPSGTEQLVRVMVEANDQKMADDAATQIADVVERELA